MKTHARLMAAITAATFLIVSLSLRSDAGSSSYDAVVIGAGGGGLAAAATLAKNGKKVLLIERHYKVGGYMTNFEREDYTFEVSLHSINGLDEDDGTTRVLFEQLGIMDKVKPIRLDPAYRVAFPDFEMDVPADPEEYKNRLLEKFPGEEKGVNDFFKTMHEMQNALVALKNLNEGKRMKALGLLLTDPRFQLLFKKNAGRTLSQFLDDYTQDKKLRAVLSWMCGYAGAPPDAMPANLFIGMWASYHYSGFYYFEGGSQAVSDALAEVIEENGGEIMVSTAASKIVIEDGRAVAVETEDGQRFSCGCVVSNANAPDTLFKMVGRDNLPADYVARVEKMKIGPTILQVFLGVDHDYRDAFSGNHTISVYESYDVDTLLSGTDPEKMGYFIVNYSEIDKAAAPEGKNVIVITTYMPYDWNNGWREEESYAAYAALKDEVGKTFTRRAEKHLPGLSSHVEVMEVGSPRTMEHFTGNPKGAVYGWAIDLDHFDKNRLEQETPIPNLFLASAWTQPGHGQAAVMESGRTAAEKILKMDK